MRKIAVSFTIFMLVIFLAACGSSGEGGGASESGEDSITLAVWGSSPAESEALEETVTSFEEAKGIDVQIEVIQDNFQDALTARFAADNAPDVFYLESYVAPSFIESGVLADISGDINNQEDFYQPQIDAFKDDEGNLFAVPKDYSTLAMYVNEDMLNEAGYSVEDVPNEWDELLQFSEELQSNLDDGQASMIFDSTMARHLSGLLASGLDPVTEDNQADFTSSNEANEYLQSIVDGQDAGYLKNPKIDLGIDSAGAAFGTNQAAIMIEGNWVISALNQNYSDVSYEVLSAPTINGEEQSISFNVGYAISKDTANKDASVEFVNYMTGEGLQQWSEISGTLPPRESVAEEMNLTENENIAPHVNAAEYATVWSSGVNLPTIATSFDNYFSAALNGDMTVEEAMQAAEDEANAEIERQQ
ncbi:multiple sugar transport system substrate-binding protein [Virgibacillus natechei]|uniref:Multiple sugar transport system substrate-binding protein n=1 Tax=Virgibacillus natechei TaxID=1216297 RepID=A0ABS4ILQ5_9BACI|nr:extracellular solute-binding protein [Virgibacillus natechei]MBP1971351.1 multiple sugar transport system substrate-binding protein [Virgibacillus natechei]UZD12914.1 extracellular solute-binding protein [Virgibacillus natechei]